MALSRRPQLSTRFAPSTNPEPAQPQLITLAVGPLCSREDTESVRWILGRVGGVEAVDADQEAVCVWVFGDGTVEPMALVDELTSCGFGAVVLGQELQIFQ